MKLLIVCSLLALAFVPLASAGGAGASFTSAASGDCAGTSGYHHNTVSASASAAGVGSARVQGGTFCQAYRDWFTGQQVRASEVYVLGQACTGATGCSTTFVDWFSYSFGSFSYCQTTVYNNAAGSNYLGCPAGNAPIVPGVLP